MGLVRCWFVCFAVLLRALGGVIYSSAVGCLDGCFFVVALGWVGYLVV